MTDDTAIKVDDVSKTFKLPHERHSSIKTALINIGRTKRGYEKQHVLKNISFEIKKGEFFGIVGRNGSGKSTLLKLLAGIYTPDKGTITINGKLTPFIELGVGFNPELSGRENVFLNGALLGFNRKEMEAMYDEIVEFAELERFMDQKLKNYSSGMQVRLAFSIAIRAQSDILLLDEVLAVGDLNFQKKCFSYFAELKKNKKTVILVSHDQDVLVKYCDNGVLIDDGKLILQGQMKRVVKKYLSIMQKTQLGLNKKKETQEDFGNGHAGLVQLQITDELGGKAQYFQPNENIEVKFTYKANIALTHPTVGMVISDESGKVVVATNTIDGDLATPSLNKGDIFTVVFTVKNIFGNGNYSVSGALASTKRDIIYSRTLDIANFYSAGWEKTAAAPIYPQVQITIE